MLNTKIESLFSIYCFIFFQGICSECRITLGEQVRADSQDPQLIALSESIHELSLVSISYFGSLAHTINFICSHTQDQSQNFVNLPSNSDSPLPFLNHILSNAMVVPKDFQAFMPHLVFYILKGPSQPPPFSMPSKLLILHGEVESECFNIGYVPESTFNYL